MNHSIKTLLARSSGLEGTAKTSRSDKLDTTRCRTKRQHVLSWLIEQSLAGRKITRFDTSRIGDTCLNTTVSEIGRFDRIVILRESTTWPTRFNRPVACTQYWIDPSHIAEAQKILAGQIGGAA